MAPDWGTNPGPLANWELLDRQEPYVFSYRLLNEARSKLCDVSFSDRTVCL